MLFTGISGHRSSFVIATLVLIGLSLTARQVECDNTGMSMISAKLANTSESSYFEPDTPIGEVNLDDMRNLCNATYKITDGKSNIPILRIFRIDAFPVFRIFTGIE